MDSRQQELVNKYQEDIIASIQLHIQNALIDFAMDGGQPQTMGIFNVNQIDTIRGTPNEQAVKLIRLLKGDEKGFVALTAALKLYGRPTLATKLRDEYSRTQAIDNPQLGNLKSENSEGCEIRTLNPCKDTRTLKAIGIAAKSVFKLIHPYGKATGFLVQIELIYGYLTNNHVLVAEHLHDDAEITIVFEGLQGKEFPNLRIHPEAYRFTSSLLDATFVQLMDAQVLELKEAGAEFLKVDAEPTTRVRKGMFIAVVQHPLASDQQVNDGHVVALKGVGFLHDAGTEPGSSGGAVLNTAGHVTGLHRGWEPATVKNVAIHIFHIYNAIRLDRLNAANSLTSADNQISKIIYPRKPPILSPDKVSELKDIFCKFADSVMFERNEFKIQCGTEVSVWLQCTHWAWFWTVDKPDPKVWRAWLPASRVNHTMPGTNVSFPQLHANCHKCAFAQLWEFLISPAGTKYCVPDKEEEPDPLG